MCSDVALYKFEDEIILYTSYNRLLFRIDRHRRKGQTVLLVLSSKVRVSSERYKLGHETRSQDICYFPTFRSASKWCRVFGKSAPAITGSAVCSLLLPAVFMPAKGGIILQRELIEEAFPELICV